MPLLEFSVSMCVYGGDNADHFNAAIDSIIAQTVKPTELVLTVDGPIPDTVSQVIEKYRKELENTTVSFKVVYLEKNMGHGEARRICFNNCSCSLIALMDADDLSSTERFEKEISAFMADPDLSIVGSHISEFSDNNPRNITARRIVKLSDEEIKHDIKIRCPMNQPTVMFKKEDINEVGGYVDWYCNEDYYLWIRLALANKKFMNIDDYLVNMRVNEESYQRRGGIEYFKSEAKIQNLLFKTKMIGIITYSANVIKRYIVQVLMSNKVRSWVFKKFARS